MRAFNRRLALALVALTALGMGFASAASASSVSNTGLTMHDNGGSAITSAPAGSTRGFWLSFTLTNALAAGQTITIQGPEGVVFPATSRFDYPIYIQGGPAYVPSAITSVTRGIRLTLAAGNSIAAGQTVTITMPFDKTNFIGVGTTAGEVAWAVATSTDINPASTPPYTITPGPLANLGVPGGGGISATVGTNFSNSGQVVSALDQYFNAIPGAQVNLSTPTTGPSGTFAGGVRTTSVTMGSAGQALIPTTTAGTVAGSWDMTISAPGATSKPIPRTNVAGVAENISISLNPTSIIANGTSQSTATVIVSDTYGNRRSGDDVRIGAISGGPTIGTVTSQGNGVYTAPITSTTTAGGYSITATDRTPSTPIGANPATLTQTAGPLHHFGVPSTVASATVNTAFSGVQAITAFDQFNNPRPSQQINLTTPTTGATATFAGGSHATTVTTNSVGQVAVPATTAGTVAGTWEMSVAAPSGSPSTTFGRTNLAGVPSEVSLHLDPSSIPADGTSTTTATAEVGDEYGNPIEGQDVSFEASGGQSIGPVTDNGDGTYSATLTSTTAPGASTVTATDGTPVTPVVSGPATLEQTVLPATGIAVKLNPASIPADRSSTTTATVTVTNALGSPVAGETVQIDSSGGQQIGAVTDNGNGTYTATITSSAAPGESTISAIDASPAQPIGGSAVLTQTAVDPPPPPPEAKPVLAFVKPPKKKVRAGKVKFRFKVVDGRASGFQCRLDKKKWAACKSPKTVKLKRGKHVFQVRGIATDGTFGKPITRKIRRTR